MAKKAPLGATPEMTLEEAMLRLEEIAARLEGGELELAESLAHYEEGVGLLRVCEGLLSAAETRIEHLRADGTTFRPDPLAERT